MTTPQCALTQQNDVFCKFFFTKYELIPMPAKNFNDCSYESSKVSKPLNYLLPAGEYPLVKLEHLKNNVEFEIKKSFIDKFVKNNGFTFHIDASAIGITPTDTTVACKSNSNASASGQTEALEQAPEQAPEQAQVQEGVSNQG